MTYGELISAVTVGAGGASSISFTSIPGSFTDLILVMSLRTNGSSVADLVYVTPNSDNTFTSRRLTGNGSSASSSSQGWGNMFYAPDGTSTSSTFGNGQLYIPNYAGSTNKSMSADGVGENNSTTSYQTMTALTWGNTAAITSLTIASIQSYNFVQYSTAYLYGLTKGSGGASVS